MGTSTATANANDLANFIRNNSIVQKEGVTLPAGGKANRYLNLGTAWGKSDGGIISTKRLIEMYTKLSSLPIKAIGCPAELKAIPFTVSLVNELRRNGQNCNSFIVRQPDSFPANGVHQQIEGHVDRGDTCLLISDIANSGKTLMDTIKTCEQNNLKVVAVMTLVDRSDGKVEEMLNAVNIKFLGGLAVRNEIGLDPKSLQAAQ